VAVGISGEVDLGHLGGLKLNGGGGFSQRHRGAAVHDSRQATQQILHPLAYRCLHYNALTLCLRQQRLAERKAEQKH